MDFNELAKTYQTPLYVYDFDHISRRYEELKNIRLFLAASESAIASSKRRLQAIF